MKSRAAVLAGPGHPLVVEPLELMPLPVHAFFGIGSLSEYVIAPAAAAVALPEDVTWRVGALLACAGQTGLGSVFNIARVTEGSSVAVFGCGPVGLCVIMASRIAGAAMVIGLDVVEDRLALAQ